jgi:hypothetical protein
MSRLILLDSGPLGMVTNPKAEGIPLACQLWLKSLLRRGERVAIPEIADYADSKALDEDVILSAQARLLYNETTEVIVATTNVAHLSRFITALDWQSID